MPAYVLLPSCVPCTVFAYIGKNGCLFLPALVHTTHSKGGASSNSHKAAKVLVVKALVAWGKLKLVSTIGDLYQQEAS